MSQALYRKYRSKSLAEVVGQDHITDILTRALKAGRIAHAYLFTGPRGVGKTSIARILAHEINQLPYSDETSHLDIIEIDAASNNGVEDVRDLREKVQLAPVSASKKVYIIDEVHMLSKPAFNALLKTLEEPPAHVVFILATTDIEKLPATIISRTQRYGFRAISIDDAIKHLHHIAKEEKIKVSDDALQLVAERGDGSFRDSISLLDQLASLADDKDGITAELVESSLGLAPATIISDLLSAVEKHDVASIAKTLSETEASGISATVLNSQLTQTLRAQAATKPQVLPLLDALLDVPKSTQPAIKLLSVLGTFALDHKPKNAALATPVLEVSATIEELSKQATQPAPKMKPVAAQQATPTVSVAISQPASTPAPEPESSEPLSEAIEKSNISLPETESEEFNWQALLDHTRAHHIALYSVLSKCNYHLSEQTLTLYTRNAFYKKKIDDAKYSTHLYDSLKQINAGGISVETLPVQAPIKDSQAASVADIMGGGEAIAIEEAAI